MMAGATVISDRREAKAPNGEDTALFAQQVTLALIPGSTHQTEDEERREGVKVCAHTLEHSGMLEVSCAFWVKTFQGGAGPRV